jgi:beta-glucanase (GH16 family)
MSIFSKIVLLTAITFIVNGVCSGQGNNYRNLPDTIILKGSIYALDWIDELDSKNPGWATADWSWNMNWCEFRNENVVFDQGYLNLLINKKDSGVTGKYPDSHYWGGEYYSGQEAYMYGLFIVGMKPNTPPGVVTSFFMMSNNSYQAQYTNQLHEIDIEFAGTTKKVQFTLHYDYNVTSGAGKSVSRIITLKRNVDKDFHQWAVEWKRDEISYYLDDSLLTSFNDTALIHKAIYPKNVRANYWISGYPSWVGEFSEDTLPLQTQYDYFAYYKLISEAPDAIRKAKSDNELKYNYNRISEIVTIFDSEQNVKSISVIDIMGHELMKTNKINQISFQGMPEGFYFLRVTGKQRNYKGIMIVKD